MSHNHYCSYKRHLYPCPAGAVPSYSCLNPTNAWCPACVRQSREVASIVVPVVCERCGTPKRADDGRTIYVALRWLRERGDRRRMVCPDCYEGEKTIEGLDRLVNTGDNDWEELPF